MRSIRIRLSLLMLIGLVVMSMLIEPILAQERNIYIGDLITIEIKTKEFSEEELIKAFEAVEVVDIEESKGGYSVTIRSSQPGEKRIIIGDREVIVSVGSTLDDINREDIFDGDLTPRSGEKAINWLPIYLVILVLFIISGIILLIRKLRRHKTKIATPYEKFVSTLESMSMTTDSCLVEMTVILKHYLEAVFECKIIGKTSDEIMSEIERIPETKSFRQTIGNWLSICDTYKFSGCQVDEEQKEKLRLDLIQIGLSIQEEDEVIV